MLAGLRMMQRRGGGPIAANLSTSRMIDDVCAGFEGASVVRTAVGEANVVQGIRSSGGAIGGEGGGPDGGGGGLTGAGGSGGGKGGHGT